LDIELKKNCSLKDLSYFKIGGIAENVYFPANIEEFVFLLKTLPEPLIFGGFSNVLFSSSGIKRDIICTLKLDKFEIDNTNVKALTGVRGAVLSRACAEKSLTGFEFMSGFPGSIGGNVFMNASAHGQSISDFLIAVDVFDLDKKHVLTLSKSELGFSYRSSTLQNLPYILLSAEFELKNSEKEIILEKIKSNIAFRKEHQPQGIPNVGSIFKNPEGLSAGKLLDDVGAKNLKFGGAEVYVNHANFIINILNATSTDVLELMFEMYSRVKEKFGVELQPEVKFFGEKTEREDEICKILFQK